MVGPEAGPRDRTAHSGRPTTHQVSPEVLVGLMRMAAEVLDAEGALRHLDALWVSRHVVVQSWRE